MTINCIICGKGFYIFPCRLGKLTCCSRVCNIERKKQLLEVRQKDIHHPKNEKHPGWKGLRVGYRSLHIWVSRRLNRTGICKNCGKITNRTHWSNISHKYLRDVRDYIELCAKCNSNYDRGNISLTGLL